MNTLSMSFQFEQLPTETIILEFDEVTQAVELSRRIPNDRRQWQTYLNSLSLFIFKKWLEERDDNLMVIWEKSTIAKPELANLISIVTNLQINKFKVCLISLGNFFDEQVGIPRLVIELTEFIPHFYVLVEVLEEQECGIVRGFISYPELLANLKISHTIHPQVDWHYTIPLIWFNNDINHLLLYLRSLDPERISLPIESAKPKSKLSNIESQLVTLLPQLQTPERELWEILTWEQGSVVLTSPELIDWIYKLQTSDRIGIQNLASLQKHLLDLMKLIAHPAVNVGRWLWDEVDEIGRQFSWTLLPRFREAGAMRSPTEEFAAIHSQLQAQGIELPLVARSGYQNFLLAGVSLRLYAVTWNSSTEDEPNTWNLLLILATPLPSTLPENLRLRVSDQTGILVEEELSPQQRGSYLYTRVVGEWNEKFVVTASLGDRIEVTLPPFAFDLTK